MPYKPEYPNELSQAAVALVVGASSHDCVHKYVCVCVCVYVCGLSAGRWRSVVAFTCWQFVVIVIIMMIVLLHLLGNIGSSSHRVLFAFALLPLRPSARHTMCTCCPALAKGRAVVGGGAKLHPPANNVSHTILVIVIAASQFVHSLAGHWVWIRVVLLLVYLARCMDVCVQRTLSSHTIQPWLGQLPRLFIAQRLHFIIHDCFR